MKTRDAIEDFLVMRSVELTAATHKWYAIKLRGWAEEVGDKELDSIRPLDIALYLTAHKTGRSSYTAHGTAQVIKGFMRWCLDNNYLEKWNPKSVPMPKVDQKIIEVFTMPHIKQLLAATAREETPALAARDKAVILFLLDTGVRSAELCGLTLDHLDLPHCSAKVFGKGRKERIVSFGGQTQRMLIQYIRRYRRGESAFVFTTKRGGPLTGSGLDQMLYRLEAWTSIEGVRVSAHTFRHTFAVNYLLQGGDVYALSRILGHTSISTTQVYLRAAKDSQLTKARPSLVDTLLTS